MSHLPRNSKGKYVDDKKYKVKNHCHYIVEYRGVAHDIAIKNTVHLKKSYSFS